MNGARAGKNLRRKSDNCSRLRVNTTIFGEDYFELYSELRRRGLVRNLPDMLLRGLELLRQSIIDSDLKRAQLRTLKNSVDASPEEG